MPQRTQGLIQACLHLDDCGAIARARGKAIRERSSFRSGGTCTCGNSFKTKAQRQDQRPSHAQKRFQEYQVQGMEGVDFHGRERGPEYSVPPGQIPTASQRTQCLNNLIEQEHRFIKRRVRPMIGFKSFASAASTIAGIKIVNMIRKGQFRPELRPYQ